MIEQVRRNIEALLYASCHVVWFGLETAAQFGLNEGIGAWFDQSWREQHGPIRGSRWKTWFDVDGGHWRRDLL